MPSQSLITTDEKKRMLHAQYLGSIMPSLLDRLGWDRARIDQHKLEKLRALLGYSKNHSKWHASRLEQIDPEQFSLEDLRLVPTMDKPMLMANWDGIVTVPEATLTGAEAALKCFEDQGHIWGDHVLLASGGTGGRPGLFLYDWHSFAENFGGMARILALAAVRNFDGRAMMRAAAIGAEPSAHGSYTFSKMFSDPSNPVLRLSAWRELTEIVPALNDFQPESLACYPSFVPELVESVLSGVLKIDPRVIFLNSESLSESNAALARQAWPQAEVFTCWSTSEGVGTFPCPSGDGFHVSEDVVIIEPVDEQGEPTKPGEVSHGIYLTNLSNMATPIIRYYIDDMFEMDAEPCVCGLAFQKVRRVHGRSFERFTYGDIAVHPLRLELAVLQQPRVLEYQLLQTENGIHFVYRAEEDLDLETLEFQFLEAFKSYGLDNAQITLERVYRPIKRTGAGKLKRFVPLG